MSVFRGKQNLVSNICGSIICTINYFRDGRAQSKNHPGCFSSLQWSVMPCTGLVKFLSSIMFQALCLRDCENDFLNWTTIRCHLWLKCYSFKQINKEQIELHIINLVVLYTYSFEMYNHLMELYVWLVIIYIVVQIMFVNGVIYYVRLTCLHTRMFQLLFIGVF